MNDTNKCIRIVFTGDISFSGYFSNRWQDSGVMSDEIKAYLNASDYVIANIESPISNLEISSDRKLNHKSPPEAVQYLKNNNVRIWNLANNHILDCGVEGLIDTFKYADAYDCKIIGAGKNLSEASEPLILDKTIKVGIISIARPWRFIKSDENTPGAFTWEKEEVLEQKVRYLKSIVDYIVIIVHAGDEFCSIPMPYMRKRYIDFLKLGADIIVAHHPHVIQNYEVIDNKIIFYSLGNFIFDTENQRDFAHTDEGELIGINFSQSGFTFDSLPTKIDRTNNTVVVGKEPAIFQNIEKKEYEKLWPLAAKCFYYIDKKKRLKFNLSLKKLSQFRFLIHEILSCVHTRQRTIQLGKLKSLFAGWKKSGKPSVIKYLLENEKT